MSQSEHISFFVSKDFYDFQGSTLICGSALKNLSEEAGRLGRHSILLLNQPSVDVVEFAGRDLVASWAVPSNAPGQLLHGHGAHCLALLDFACELEWDYLWYVHHEVYLAADWANFFASFENSEADFIAPCIRTRESDSGWYWWDALEAPAGTSMPPANSQLAALSTIFRISRRAFDQVKSAVLAGWLGHCEAIFPTAIANAGFQIEDIGSYGEYTPESRKGLHYSNSTFSSDMVPGHIPGFLHYPASAPVMPPSPQRFRPATKYVPKILYFSPIGLASPGLLHDTVARFRKASAEFLLVEYQSPGIEYPKGCKVVFDKGQKWELVARHLDPESIKEFDYVFVWDDDISIANFDVLRFLKIMESNRLDVAQPSLISPHPICHSITRRKPCAPPLGNLNRVGRLTNFVEIMVPVFTRDSWAEFYSYLNPTSRLGWGMDSLLLGRKGIVDCMHVVHTRPCSQYGASAIEEMRDFLNSQGLFECRHQELGFLLEEPYLAL